MIHQGTAELYKFLKSNLLAADFDKLWECFFANGTPSIKRYKMLFEGSGRIDITVCTPQEVKAVSELSGISCSELMSVYGMGQDVISLKEANQLVQEEGMEYAPVMHAA